MEFEGNEYKAGPSNPEFNAAFAYLYRLDNMNRQAEVYMINSQPKQAYIVLRLIHSEIIARAVKAKNKEVIKNMKARLATIKSCQSKGVPAELYVDSLYDWFDTLNEASHKLGLIMPDKNDFSGGADVV